MAIIQYDGIHQRTIHSIIMHLILHGAAKVLYKADEESVFRWGLFDKAKRFMCECVFLLLCDDHISTQF